MSVTAFNVMPRAVGGEGVKVVERTTHECKRLTSLSNGSSKSL